MPASPATAERPSRPDYGLDAPGIVRFFLILGVCLFLLGWFFPRVRIGPVIFITRPMGEVAGPAFFLQGVLMILYSRYGKFRHRDRMLALVPWKGTESVLDVGTGRGLMMIGAAQRLTTGKSVGIDIWSGKDLSGNSMENTRRNAELEGVSAKVEVLDGDATALQFPDASFDVVLSNLCLHNIPGKARRDQACREIVRVLKPGAKAVISDFKGTASYARAFRAAGALVTRRIPNWFTTFPALTIVEVEKPQL